MQSTTNPKPADDPHDVIVVAPDVALTAPTEEELSQLARSWHQPVDPRARPGADLAASATVPPVDTTFRPAATGDVRGNVGLPGRRRTIGGVARAFTVALLLAACTAAAGIAWQFYGAAAEPMIAQWVPQRLLTLLLPLDQPAPVAQPAPAAVEAAAANPAASQAGSPAQTEPAGVAPAAATSVVSAPSLGAMGIDIASMRQQVDELKASIEELKASQQQMSRDIARASQAKAYEAKTSASTASAPTASEFRAPAANLRTKLPAHPVRPATAPARKPMPVPPPQAAAYPALPPPAPAMPPRIEPQPPATAESLADPELASVPRPPMPLR